MTKQKMKQSLNLAFLKEKLLLKNNIRMLYNYILTCLIYKNQYIGGAIYERI